MYRSSLRRVVFPALVLALAAPVAAAAAAPAKVQDCDSVVGRVGDTNVTLKELDARVLSDNAKLAQSLFEARDRALEQLLGDRLLELEAKAEKTTVDELLKKEEAAAGEVTDAEADKFYNENKARMGNRPLEEMRGQVREFLVSQRAGNARIELVNRLKAKHSASNLLDPPRVDVQIAANAPRKGPDAAPVRIVEFSDFQ